METKVYLGDSVYAELESGMIKLTTENGFGASNIIYLEPEVFDALTLFVARRLRASLDRCPCIENGDRCILPAGHIGGHEALPP
jgi:hypothetical protein